MWWLEICSPPWACCCLCSDSPRLILATAATDVPWDRMFPGIGSAKPGQTETSLRRVLSQEEPDRSAGDRFLGSVSPASSLWWRLLCWLPGLLWLQGCCFQHDCRSGEKAGGAGQVKVSQSLFLLKFSCFSYIDALASLWLISRVLGS